MMDCEQNQNDPRTFYKLNAQKIVRTKGQYLTNLFNQEYCKNFHFYRYFDSQIIKEAKQKKVNIQSVISCIIQCSYFLYVAFWYRIQIGQFKIAYDTRELKLNQPINIYIFYKILNTDNKIQLIKELKKLIAIIIEVYQRFQNCNEIPMKNFQSQYSRILPEIYNDLTKQKDFMLCLEQTELFRKYSLMLKIKNCSILNIIKSDQLKLKLLADRKAKQKQIIQNFNIYKKQKNQAKLTELEFQLERNIKEFFSNTLKFSTRFTEQEVVKDQPYRLKFYLRFHQKNITISENQKLEREAKENKEKQTSFEKEVGAIVKKFIPSDPNMKTNIPINTLQFLIEYSSQRNSICVKLITQIQLSVQTSDFLMFQSNNLSFDSSNVSLQLIEKTVNSSNPNNNTGPQKMRFLAFKGTSCFTQKQPPIQKILLLIDITMITYRGLQQEIMKSVVNSKDYLKSQELHKKINHYIAIINFVSKKVYATNEEPLRYATNQDPSRSMESTSYSRA